MKNTMWPVMLTPFTESGEIDYPSLGRLIEWYEENGADGLFSLAQSSEIMYLSLEERIQIASFVKKHASVPVIASGHVSCAPSQQLEELKRIADTGVDALVLITNRMIVQYDDRHLWLDHLFELIDGLDTDIPLGLYECPVPYKYLLSDEELETVAKTGRFRFMKDTCCDTATIAGRMKVLKGTALDLYNANTATLLDSLHLGAAGYSGIMANIHPDLYARLLSLWQTEPQRAEDLQAYLTIASLIEDHLYPVCAKYDLVQKKILSSTYTRSQNHKLLTPVIQSEIHQLELSSQRIREWLG